MGTCIYGLTYSFYHSRGEVPVEEINLFNLGSIFSLSWGWEVGVQSLMGLQKLAC